MANLAKCPLYILAGGMATRLGAVSKALPKYLMDVGGGRAFADLHLSWVAEHGFEEVCLCLGHLCEKVMDYCSDGSKWGLKINYSLDGPDLLGTGGAVYKAWSSRRDEYFALTYGDTLLSFPVQHVFDRFEQEEASALMTVLPNRVEGHKANVLYVPGSLRAAHDKFLPPQGAAHIDYGFLFFRDCFLKNFPQERPLDLSTPLANLSRGDMLFAYEVFDRFWEIGSPEALGEFRRRVNKA